MEFTHAIYPEQKIAVVWISIASLAQTGMGVGLHTAEGLFW